MRKVIFVICSLIIFSCGEDEETGNANNNIPPNPPILITPNNGSTLITQNVDEEIYFEWNPSFDPDNDVVNYFIEVAYDSNFNDFVAFINTSETYRSIYLNPNNNYYWRVKSNDSNLNESSFSQTWSFYIEDGLAPTPPQLIFPLTETECSNDNLTFEWNASTDSSGGSIDYKLHVSTSSTFESNVDLYSTSNTFYDVDLPQSTALYWRVEAVNNSNNSSFSETRSLYTQGAGATNTIPQIDYIFPENDAIISDQSPLLQWQASDNETSNTNLNYKVYFSEVGQNLILIEENTDISSYEVSGLDFGISYQWSIWVTDEDGATNVGEVQRFSVE